METKRTLEFDTPVFTLSTHALRRERLIGGLLSLALTVGLTVAVCLRFSGWWLAVGLAAAAVLAALSVWQLAWAGYGKYPYSLVLTERALILREKRVYHYIRFADLGKLSVRCAHRDETYCGDGYERLDVLDGEIYYYLGEIKKRFATREAETVAGLLFEQIGRADAEPDENET